MKKIILLALTALMMVGCLDYNSEPNRNIDTKTEGTLYGTIIIDSCEYIKGYRRLAHKGNCRFCKERRQKELEKLVINNGRYCTEEQYRTDRIEEENKRLRLERDKYFRMYVSLEKDNERLTRELMVLKSKIQDLM